MDPSLYQAPEWGAAKRTLGSASYVAFEAAPLPRRLRLDPETVAALSAADTSLGRLGGAGELLPNPHLLLTPFMHREALASSRIEGTQASLSDVFEAEAGGSDNMDVREVRNYVAAMGHGLARLQDLPLSGRLVREMHAMLMRDVRGHERTPGEFRRSQNWIGPPGATLETAIFVPPTGDTMIQALSDWERFMHEDSPLLPLLVKTALLHYQFETIHPFLDGNGRLGRLFIVLYIVEQGVLPSPLLPLSPFFEAHRQEYYERLQAIRECGDVQPYLRFFLRGVETQAADAVNRAAGLLRLRESYRGQLAGSRSRATDAVDLLFVSPVVTRRWLAARLKASLPTVSKVLRQLVELGILRERSPGQGSLSRWYADEILALLED